MCLGVALAAVACSNNANRGVTSTVGVDTGVALSTAGSVTSLLAGDTLGLGATVENPSNNAGVTWTLSGVGTLTAVTSTTATYNAPPDTQVTGSQTALITATAVANPAQLASVALIVFGTPEIDPVTMFPANVAIGYAASVSAAGGDAPFTWVLLSGTLPPGLALNGSTSSSTAIEGTPTTAGTYSFTLQATDSLSRVATVALSMVVNSQAACVITGRYTFLSTGFRGGSPATHTGAVTISSAGTVTGEQDYKDGHRTTSAETLTSGTCITRQTNSGVLTLNAPSGQLVYNFSATPPDTSGVIHSAELQLISSGSDSGSGQLVLQDATAITAAAPSGDFAFGLFGIDPSENHFGTAGRFTSTAGILSAGVMDSNAASALTNAPMTGTISAPDANGRGTLTLMSGSQTTTLAYYLVNAGKMFMIDIDSTASSPSTRMAGQMTAQVGNAGASTFDDGALGSPSVLSLFGAVTGPEPVTVMALGRLSNANTTAGTVDLVLDTSDQLIATALVPYNGQSYAVATNGRGTLSLANTTSVRSFAMYFDAIANGYILEMGSPAGSVGLLEAQFQGPYPSPPPSGIFPPTLPNAFVSSTAFPQAPGPITLESMLYLNFDSLSSDFLNGTFAIDSTTGRGLGSVVENGVGTEPAVLYLVSPSKMDLLQWGSRAVDGTIEFMTQ
jgi:putative Ig domain-containing protein